MRWYLSFVIGDKFAGACMVEADNPAVRAATALGHQPPAAR